MVNMKDAGRNPRAAVVAALIAFLVAGPRAARAANDPTTKIPWLLELQAQTDGRVRVLVHLAFSVSSPDSTSDRSAWARWRRAIAAGQGGVVRDMGNRRGRITRKFHSVPFLAMDVDSDALAALNRSNDIIDVREDSAVPLALIDSAPLIGADKAWAIGRDGIASPACISSAVSVGCTSKSDEVCAFSDSATFLSLWAPGLNIFSSVPGGDFDFLSGTSMSAPHVAGAWAVVREMRPTANVDAVLQALRTSGLPITDPRNGIAVPRINVRNAITELACGNGALDPGEACDDGNRISG